MHCLEEKGSRAPGGTPANSHSPELTNLDALIEEWNSKRPGSVEAHSEAEGEFPTPEQIRDTIGPPLGTAMEVLNEFPEYEEAFNGRR